MNKSSPIRLLVGLGGAAVLLAASSTALAAPPKIWVDVRPWTCASELGPFGRHVQLACDSIGGACEVAASEKQADFRASLACGEPEAWSLVLQKSDGSEVLSLALGGDREQRLRKAAVWVAHASVGEPPPRRVKPGAAPVQPAEEPPPAELPPVEPPPAEPPAKPRAPQVVPVPAPREIEIIVPKIEPEPTPEPAAREEQPRGGIALSGFGGMSSRRDVIAGARAYVAFPLGAGFALAPALNYARSVGHGEGGNLLLAGAMVGWGAPFGGRWIGFSLEGGGGASLGESSDRGGEMWGSGHGGHARHSFYGRAAGTLQFPIDFAVRPFVSIAGTHVSNQFGRPAQTAMLDVGFAWRAF